MQLSAFGVLESHSHWAGLNEIRVGEKQFGIQCKFVENKMFSQHCGVRIVDKCRDSGQRATQESLRGESVLRGTYLCVARVVPAPSDGISAESFHVPG